MRENTYLGGEAFSPDWGSDLVGENIVAVHWMSEKYADYPRPELTYSIGQARGHSLKVQEAGDAGKP